MCWEIFNGGCEPYADWNQRELIQCLKRGERLAKPDSCHYNIWGFILRCFEMDPHARPTFEELYNFLTAQVEDVLEEEEDSATPTTSTSITDEYAPQGYAPDLYPPPDSPYYNQ